MGRLWGGYGEAMEAIVLSSAVNARLPSATGAREVLGAYVYVHAY